jgi:hypothetical protein
MVSKKVLLAFCVVACMFAGYTISGCIKGERDDTPLTIVTQSLPPGQAGAAYICTLEAIGGTPPYKWTVETGGSGLPPGLYMSESGNITGTPSSEGSYSFTVKVSDSDNYTRSQSKNLSIEVYPKGEVTITTGALTPAYVSEAYEGQLSAVGGEQPYVWSIASGGVSATELVPNLFLSSSGNVTGTPTTAGIYTVEVRVDEFGGSFDTKDITITVYEPQEELAILSASPLPNRSIAGTDSYPYALSSSGGVAPRVWSVETGSAPLIDAGLTLAADGTLSHAGSPLEGEYSFSLKVTDDNGAGTSITKVFKVTVVP